MDHSGHPAARSIAKRHAPQRATLPLTGRLCPVLGTVIIKPFLAVILPSLYGCSVFFRSFRSFLDRFASIRFHSRLVFLPSTNLGFLLFSRKFLCVPLCTSRPLC